MFDGLSDTFKPSFSPKILSTAYMSFIRIIMAIHIRGRERKPDSEDRSDGYLLSALMIRVKCPLILTMP